MSVFFYAKKTMKNPANRRFAVADGKGKKREKHATSAMGSESHVYVEDTHSVSVFFLRNENDEEPRKSKICCSGRKVEEAVTVYDVRYGF